MGYKYYFIIYVFAFTGHVSEGAGFEDMFGFLSGPKASVKDVKDLACAYTDPKAKAKNSAQCKTCGEKVSEWKGKFQKIADGAISQDKGYTSVASGAGAKSAADLGSSSVDSTKAGATTDQAATFGELSRSKSATSAAAEFKQCSKEIHEKCDKLEPMPDDLKSLKEMVKACDDSAAGAGKVAAETKKAGDSLGDMSKLLDTATKAMGAAAQLAQMMQQQQASPTQSSLTDPNSSLAGSDGGATSPTPTSTNNGGGGTGSSPTDGTGASGGIAPSTVGFGVPATGSTVGASNNGLGGNGAGNGVGSSYGSNGLGAGSGASSGSRDLASAGSSPLGSGGSGGGVGSSGGSGGSIGGSGGGSSNSSGASRPGEGSGAAADAGSNYEVSGGGGRAIVGLKPSKGDLEAISDGAITPPAIDAKLEDLGAKTAAGDNAAADDVLAHDGESIFLRVRQKYSLLKGAGRI